MFIILSIYSKNRESLTNFLKFFYKLKEIKILKLKLYTKQSQKKRKNILLSVLKSPHVNKKSQEQFECNLYTKQLNIWVYQLNKFLFLWKWIKTKLFFDINVKIKFLLDKNSTASLESDKIDCERYLPTTVKKKNYHILRIYKRLKKKSERKTWGLTSKIKQTFFKLTDIQGEKLLKSMYKVSVK
jgi:ribosomal protein S10